MYVSLVTNYGLVVLLNNCSVFPVALFSRYHEEAEKVEGRSMGSILIFATCLDPLWPSGPLRSDHNEVSVPKLKYFGV